MKNFLLIATVAAIAGGAWFFLTSPALDTPTEELSGEIVEADNMPETESVTTEEELPATIEESPDAAAVVFTVTGSNFEYDLSEIRVQVGDTVTINFESEAGFHDWVVDEFNAATDKVRPGTPTSVTFVASRAGTYEYYCSIGSHRANGMVGNLIVE
jgi:plastocyanin